MKNLVDIKRAYFIGIGGIGMSAIARYFNLIGINVAGYDRMSTQLTDQLTREGIHVHFSDDPGMIPQEYLNPENTLVVYTPAISSDNREVTYLVEKGHHLWKRSEVLGKIIEGKRGIAVAGTHGKTTVSSMIATIIDKTDLKCNAFLGGISKNFGSNILLNKDSEIIVVEADEFDRSFLQLYPEIAVVTSLDADHLDIYGNIENLRHSFEQFLSQIQRGGKLVMKRNVSLKIPEGIKSYSYSLDDKKSDFYAEDIVQDGFLYRFSFVFPGGKITEIQSGFSGKINLENAVAALAVSWLSGANEESLRKGIAAYEGVKRRFDIQFVKNDKIYIDDYAHHPEELKAFILSVKDLINSPVTGIFQPHLYSRTKDFADGFAESLSLLDNVIILDIYPAREKPLSGVSSKLIFDKLKNKGEKILCSKDQLFKVVDEMSPQVLLTMGAGDIDQLVGALKQRMEK